MKLEPNIQSEVSQKEKHQSVQCSSVAQSCPTICNPMNYSTPGLPAHQQCLEFTQTHVCWIRDAIQPSHPLSSLSPPTFNQSASVLPMNKQNWFPLGLTGWISLLFKGLSRVFSKTTVQKHQFFDTQLLYSPTLTSIHDYWKNNSFD